MTVMRSAVEQTWGMRQPFRIELMGGASRSFQLEAIAKAMTSDLRATGTLELCCYLATLDLGN
jgi:hypothetical protein